MMVNLRFHRHLNKTLINVDYTMSWYFFTQTYNIIGITLGEDRFDKSEKLIRNLLMSFDSHS